MSGWRAPQPERRPREGAPPMRPDASRSVKVVDEKASRLRSASSCGILRARDSTGAVRAFSEAIGSEQAPSAARAVRLQGRQTGARRVGTRTRHGLWVRGREAKNAPELAEEDVVVARRPNEDSNLAPPSYAGGVPPGKSQIHVSGQAQCDLGVPPWSMLISCWARAHHAWRSREVLTRLLSGFAAHAGDSARSDRLSTQHRALTGHSPEALARRAIRPCPG